MDGILPQQLFQYWADFTDLLTVDPARLAEPDMILRICLQVFLLFCSAFFSGSETALFSLSRLDLQKIRREKHPRSETLHSLLDKPRSLIISILSGNELVNIAASANMTAILIVLYGDGHAGWINLLVMVPLLLLLGEVTPKTIAITNPVRISTSVVAGPMNVWVRLVAPLRWAIRGIADRITTLIVGEEKAAENILQVDEFLTLVEEVANEGELNATERALIYNLLEAGDTEIVEIMTPRTRTAFLNADMPIPEMVERFIAIRHSRVPVFRIHRDNIVGFLHAEDVMKLVLDNKDLNTLTLDGVIRPPVVVPLTKKVDEMFDFFQENSARAAAVLNEFGGFEGFLTIRDVLTFIFGQISEDVTGQELYQERDDNVYEVPGDMKLTHFNTLTNFGIEDPRMTTIGGVAFRHLDRLPGVGDRVIVEGITITVQEMDAHRIARVRVSRTAKEAEDEEPETGETAESGSPDTDDAAQAASGPVIEPEPVPAETQLPDAGAAPEREEIVAEENGSPLPDITEAGGEEAKEKK
uniref:Hemolysin, contains CBS domains n=1 Tax=Candidatus Kentrum sp. DK TaxID=2126562 RepID=A0A450TD95_9GAMM|nr:MAG: Hemolysin, contains CBS domains [Candidatus Kentron sp. DK]VFJ65888.1 MAG: Hemolysin, contains CBS domains [Candidatus Kentron sp. DK]